MAFVRAHVTPWDCYGLAFTSEYEFDFRRSVPPTYCVQYARAPHPPVRPDAGARVWTRRREALGAPEGGGLTVPSFRKHNYSEDIKRLPAHARPRARERQLRTVLGCPPW